VLPRRVRRRSARWIARHRRHVEQRTCQG
jgi:hypothetical protein